MIKVSPSFIWVKCHLGKEYRFLADLFLQKSNGLKSLLTFLFAIKQKLIMAFRKILHVLLPRFLRFQFLK